MKQLYQKYLPKIMTSKKVKHCVSYEVDLLQLQLCLRNEGSQQNL